jgi:tRNA pseudouridine38-40 synthase
MMRNYKLSLSYDGTDFYGWQRQPDKRTIQGALEESLTKITRKKIHVIGAGRTDAGVHAQDQVANFKANLNLKDEELIRALNSVLPDEIRINSLKKIGMDFHARKMAKSKIYQYRIFNSPIISPFLQRYALRWSSPLKVKLMKETAPLLAREADFRAFSSSQLQNSVRKVMRSEIEKKGDEIIYTVEANGFLRYMVRTIVGTLLEIGKGKMPPGRIEEIFREKKRSLAGPTIPAKGLCLIKVNY